MFNTLLENSGLKKDADWGRFVARCLALGFTLHLFAAIKSAGFYHADEHFQIIEFMNYKLGRSPAMDLPLEYGQLMRPWLMSAIFAGLTKAWEMLGINNPFDWALGYRLCSAALGFLSTVGIVLNCYRWFPEQRQRLNSWRTYAVLAMTLIWYLPALHARPSSENLSGSVFFIGISLLALYLPKKLAKDLTKDLPKTLAPAEAPRALPHRISVAIGFLFGLAFEFRYQTGFMIAGALLWLVFVARISSRTLLLILFGSLLPVVLGTLADRWGYGQWTFAPWNYVKYNLVQNHVSDSEVTPWWDYLRRASTEAWPLLGLVLLLSFPVAWARNPKHLLTWCTAPLFLVHEIIGHKELRFLFPLLHIGPVLLVLSIEDLKRYSFKWLAWGVVGIDILALLIMTSVPAWRPIQFYEQLYHFAATPEFKLYYKDDSLINFGGAKMNFYKPAHLPMVRIQEYSDILKELKNKPGPLWLFTPHLSLPPLSTELKPYCQVEFSTLPAWPLWMEQLNPLGVVDRVTNWTLHRCELKISQAP